MPPKLRHECERCGLVAEIERAGRYRDDDFLEVLQERFDYEERAKSYAKAHHDAAGALFWAQTDADLWRHQAALYRAQIVAAGIEPMDALNQQPLEEKLPF